MFRKMVIGIFVAVLASSPAFSGERKGTVTFEFDLKAPADSKEVRLWVPFPGTDENQQITDFHVAGNFTSESINSGKNGSLMLVADWKGTVSERKLIYSFMALRKERVTADLPLDRGEVPAEMKPFLDLEPIGTARKRVEKIAAEITTGRKTVLEKARAVYDWVVANMRRDPDVKGCGLSEIDRLLSEKSGKCADISSVFVALARASGVPAREIYGLRLHREQEGEITKFQHCWAEFFLPGHGWVAVDPADVLKFKLVHNPTPEELHAKADYFFGAVDEYRLRLSSGNHVILSPPQHAGSLPYFMYPYAEADGHMLNEDLYGFNMGYRITFKGLQAKQ